MTHARSRALLLILAGLACDRERPSGDDEVGTESSDTSAGESESGESGESGDGDGDGESDSGESSDESETGEPVSVAVEVGHTHSCALADDGAVKCWGDGIYGQLGQADVLSIGDDETPLSIHAIDLGGPAVQIAAGSGYNCALMEGGSVRCWGFGGYGALGYANTETIGDDELPSSAGEVDVGGTVVQITTGEAHTCARLDGGGVRCWGYGVARLGYGGVEMIGDDETPASFGDVPLGGPAIWISAGRTHTCAVLDDGGVRCWGNAWGGALGYGNLVDVGDDETPESVGDVSVGAAAEVVEIAYAHSCALTPVGALHCWGENQNGALGLGHTANIGDDELPSSAGAVDVGGPVVEVAGGYNGFTCARLDTGSLRCWGSNYFGTLGLGHAMNIGDDEAPATAGDIDLGGDVIDVSAGDTHVCALLQGGGIRCWGDSLFGALGYGNVERIGDDEVPSAVGEVEVW